MCGVAGAFADYLQMLNIIFIGENMGVAVELEEQGVLADGRNFISSFITNAEYTVLRIVGRSRKELQQIVKCVYGLLGQDAAVGFDALELKM